MSRFGFKQKDNTTAIPTTATVAVAPTTMPTTIDGVPVVVGTTTIGIEGDLYVNLVHANEHHVRINNLPMNIDERVEHIKKMLIIFPHTAKIEQYTVTR